MQTLELTAKTVQEATQAAAQKLNVAPERIRITVLEETKGLFGKSSVRVRAEVVEAPATEEAAPVAPQVVAPVEEAPAQPAPAEKKPRSRRAPKKEAAAPAEAAPVAEAPAVEAPVEAAAPVAEDVVASEQDAEDLIEIVRELLAAAGVDVTAKSGGTTGKYVNVILDGRDVAYLVGKHGEVLNAFQYLVNIVAGRRLERGIRATLDGNDYRRRREDALTQLANKIAKQVLDRGEEAVLDALPAFERRIVHKALSEIDGVTTYSEGEEPNRRVVIAPAD